MFHKSNKTGVGAIALTAIVAIVLVSGVAYGNWRSDDHGSSDFDLGRWNEELPTRFCLNQDQIGAAQDILLDCHDECLPLRQKLQRLESEAQTYSDSHDAQPDKVRSYRRQMDDLQEEIVNLQRQANAKISDLLNNDQRSYFGNDFDWCDLGYGDQMSDYGYGGHMMNHDSHMDGWCRWDNYPQDRRTHNGHGGCCW